MQEAKEIENSVEDVCVQQKCAETVHLPLGEHDKKELAR